MTDSFDSLWEEWYSKGNFNKYPWDNIVSFIFGYAPKHIERSQIKILEIGCGSAPNLWFAAREGFNVTGIDGSKSAIQFAKDRFEEEGLVGKFYISDFTKPLPFNKDEFDLIIDRGSLVCTTLDEHTKTFSEIFRVMKPNGYFNYNGYSDDSTSYLASVLGKNGEVHSIYNGTLQGVGQLTFMSLSNIRKIFSNEKWHIRSINKKTEQRINPKNGESIVHAEWNIIAGKEH